jgi:hypothetical protein
MTAILISLAHWLAGLVVLAEALNKLERTAPLAPGLSARERFVDWLKAIAWALLALGGAGAVITPLMRMEAPSFQDMCVLLGFAVLIVRTRFKDG